jgi:hypothetical protein
MRIARAPALVAAFGSLVALSGLTASDAAAQQQPIVISVPGANPNPSQPTQPVNSLQDLAAALAGCWNPPPLDGRAPVDVIFVVSFKRSGELFGKPRVIQFNGEVTPTQRATYYTAVAEALDRCSKLPFTESMAGSAAGRVFRITFVDMRNRKQTQWLTTITS